MSGWGWGRRRGRTAMCTGGRRRRRPSRPCSRVGGCGGMVWVGGMYMYACAWLGRSFFWPVPNPTPIPQPNATGLKFFLNREVPVAWMHFVVSSFGGQVGWEGEGSPFGEAEKGITHQIVDRPVLVRGVGVVGCGLWPVVCVSSCAHGCTPSLLPQIRPTTTIPRHPAPPQTAGAARRPGVRAAAVGAGLSQRPHAPAPRPLRAREAPPGACVVFVCFGGVLWGGRGGWCGLNGLGRVGLCAARVVFGGCACAYTWLGCCNTWYAGCMHVWPWQHRISSHNPRPTHPSNHTSTSRTSPPSWTTRRRVTSRRTASSWTS